MKIVIDGKPYPFPEDLTFREMNIAKRITGLTAGELFPALMREDSDVAFVFAMIALRRSDQEVAEEDLFDWPIDKVVLDFRAEEEDEQKGPPVEEAPPEKDEGDADTA